MKNLIVTVTGPSCTGKSTLAKVLIDTDLFTEIVSTTTRPMRAGDIDGLSYHFVTKEQFDKIEMLETINFNGNYYGGSVAEFEEKFESGLIPIIVVEPNGMNQINRNAKIRGWQVLNVYIDIPPQIQAKRFLMRFIEDYFSMVVNHTKKAENIDSNFINEMISSYNGLREREDNVLIEYSNRMASMQQVESQWFNLFNEWKSDNSLYFPSYETANGPQVISKVIQTCHDLLT